jgi:hypothetical protein
VFLSGVLGLAIWIWSKKLFPRLGKYYRLLFRILLQGSLIVLITILSFIVFLAPDPLNYGSVNFFLPLSYPIEIYLEVSPLMVFPPITSYSVQIFGYPLIGGLLKFGELPYLILQIFQSCFLLIFTLNCAFQLLLLTVYEIVKKFKRSEISKE